MKVVDDTTAVEFKSYMEKYPQLYQCLAQKITHVTGDSQKPVILDIGMGPGLLGVAIHEQIPHARYIGVDPSDAMVKLAEETLQKKQLTGYRLVQAAAEQLPQKDSSVDVAVSRFSLTYWEDPGTVFSEIHRVLKPGGVLIIETLNKRFPAWRQWLVKIHMLLNHASRSVVTYHLDAYEQCYTKSEVITFLCDASLKLVEIQGKDTGWRFVFVAKKKHKQIQRIGLTRTVNKLINTSINNYKI